MYKIEVRNKARKQTLQIPPPHFQRIKKGVTSLAETPDRLARLN